MINETIIDENGEILSVHQTDKGRFVLTMDDNSDDMGSFKVFYFEPEDVDWLIKQLIEVKKMIR